MENCGYRLFWATYNSITETAHHQEKSIFICRLTSIVLYHKLDYMDAYDVIYVGFPIWWYMAPRIINTFLESYDLTGKTVIPFATSGGSGVEKVNESLRASCAGAKLIEPHLLNDTQALNELAQNT